jgi:hypothetical protein
MDDDSSLVVSLSGRSSRAKSEILKAKLRRSKGVIAMSSFICSSLMAVGDVITALFMTQIYKKWRIWGSTQLSYYVAFTEVVQMALLRTDYLNKLIDEFQPTYLAQLELLFDFSL